MIQVDCVHCGTRILVPPTVQGKQGVCFHCGRPLLVPDQAGNSQANILAFHEGDRVSDRYVIGSRLGAGGMGVVYRAHDSLVDEPVALKFMRPELLRTGKGQELFIREAQIARRLRHENIVAVHDVSWTNDGILYISMEYAEGRSLRDFLRKHRQDRQLVDVRLSVAYTKQILAALAFAHRTVIHRDMKPENVILLAGEELKVLDFGLAKAVHEEFLKEAPPSSGERKRVIGTLAYAAPEQKRLHTVDLRADIYAVGLMMHELLTLRTPLDTPVRVEDVRGDVSPSLLAVLAKALYEEKELRWASASEFKKALEEAFEASYRKTIAVANGTKEGPAASTEGMVYLEGGSFLMGCDDIREEAPEEEVSVDPFWMDAYPVTIEQYQAFIEATGHPEPRFWRDHQCNGPKQPVVGITWDDARAYADWAGKSLPTEAQWEFAARGKENRIYPWGALPPDSTLANFNEFIGMPSIVTMHEDGGTPDGIYDLAGNIYEWTLDPFVPYSTLRNHPDAAQQSPRRTVRGASWASPPDELRCTSRRGVFPEAREKTIGFRCVLAAQ